MAAHISTVNGSHWMMALVLVMVLGMMIGTVPGSSLADQSLPTVTVGYQGGTITGIYETTLQIDNKMYSLTPDAVLLDRHGDELKANALRVDIEVKFHLQKGSNDHIDRMILFLPR